MLDMRLLRAAAFLSVISGPTLALEIVPLEGRFSIGGTGVMCTTEPCPWMGVVELDNPSRDPLRPLWADSDMPKLRASEEDAASIAAAWEARNCLVVEGAFYVDASDPTGVPVLEVHSITGDCP